LLEQSWGEAHITLTLSSPSSHMRMTACRYVVLRNMRDANILFSEIISKTEKPTPMHNFLRFLLLALERDAAPLFQDLRRRYAPTIDRDGQLNMVPLASCILIFCLPWIICQYGSHFVPSQFLDAIGQMYYNIQPTQTGFQSMMSDMMKGLMG